MLFGGLCSSKPAAEKLTLGILGQVTQARDHSPLARATGAEGAEEALAYAMLLRWLLATHLCEQSLHDV